MVVVVMPDVRRRGGGRRDECSEVVARKWRSGTSSWVDRRRGSRHRLQRALVALGEEAECVNLVNKVGHACPSTESKSDHQDPTNYKCVDCVRTNPSAYEPWWWFHRILHKYKHLRVRIQKPWFICQFNFKQSHCDNK